MSIAAERDRHVELMTYRIFWSLKGQQVEDQLRQQETGGIGPPRQGLDKWREVGM